MPSSATVRQKRSPVRRVCTVMFTGFGLCWTLLFSRFSSSRANSASSTESRAPDPAAANPSAATGRTQLAFSDLTLDPGTGFLTSHGQSVRLSGREYQVMELFLRNPRMVFSAERILELVWGWENEAEINVVWVNISNLRKKLKSLGSHAVLRANRGLGYALEDQA